MPLPLARREPGGIGEMDLRPGYSGLRGALVLALGTVGNEQKHDQEAKSQKPETQFKDQDRRLKKQMCA
jgi:hypothetical protein